MHYLVIQEHAIVKHYHGLPAGSTGSFVNHINLSEILAILPAPATATGPTPTPAPALARPPASSAASISLEY